MNWTDKELQILSRLGFQRAKLLPSLEDAFRIILKDQLSEQDKALVLRFMYSQRSKNRFKRTLLENFGGAIVELSHFIPIDDLDKASMNALGEFLTDPDEVRDHVKMKLQEEMHK